MSSFTTPLLVEILDRTRDGRVEARVLESFTYEVGSEGSGERITVPAGFVTDFASIPRLFWRFEPPLGRSGKAAVVHDWIYLNNGINCGHMVRPDGVNWKVSYTRAQADDIFREALAVLGVPMWKRNMMHAAVRIGGRGGWGR